MRDGWDRWDVAREGISWLLGDPEKLKDLKERIPASRGLEEKEPGASGYLMEAVSRRRDRLRKGIVRPLGKLPLRQEDYIRIWMLPEEEEGSEILRNRVPDVFIGWSKNSPLSNSRDEQNRW
jgi:hypothetical protein